MSKVTSPQSLALACATQRKTAEQMLQMISGIASAQEGRLLERFRATLSDFDRDLFDRLGTIPYDTRDWWRGVHDIFVTRAMAAIVEGENASRLREGRSDLLPAWLVTAALVHDRGYAILGRFRNLAGAEYLGREGAHWEGADTRVIHAVLSRRYAARLLFGIADAEVEALLDCSPLNSRVSIDDHELFLRVIETHDYLFIGRYHEMPPEARHHFDADSLFSISLVSFVKDYLAYLADPDKRRLAQAAGVEDAGVFLPRGLLRARMARYFAAVEQLPGGWDVTRFPLRTDTLSFSGDLCIRPHSETARALTERAFEQLAACCVALETVSSFDDFGEWFVDHVEHQFDALCIGTGGVGQL